MTNLNPTDQLLSLHQRLSAKSGRLHVGVVGGSFTTAAPKNETWVDKLVRDLQAAYPALKVSVENGAVPAAGPHVGRVSDR